jgi:hypothetical protein
MSQPQITTAYAATLFGKYLEARGWTKTSSLPNGLHKADLAVVAKVGVKIPELVKKLVSVYLAGDLAKVYVKVEGAGIWWKRTDKAIQDIPGVAADASKAEEVGEQVQRDLTWVIVGVGATVVAVVGFIFWKRKQ